MRLIGSPPLQNPMPGKSRSKLPGAPPHRGELALDLLIDGREPREVEDLLLRLMGEQVPELAAVCRLGAACPWVTFFRRRGAKWSSGPFWVVLRFDDRSDITLGYCVDTTNLQHIRVAVYRLDWHDLGCMIGRRNRDGNWEGA